MAAAVPFALKAAPWIASGIGSLIGKKMSGPSAGQKEAMAQTQQAGRDVSALSGPLMQQGRNLVGQGTNFFNQAGQTISPAASYYTNILGSRSAANAALAPERATALDYYGGAARKTARTLRGPQRDTALAELDRQKVGQLSMMLPQARRMGAEGLERVGGFYGDLGQAATGAGVGLSGQGVNAATSGAYIGSGLFNQATQLRQQEQEGGKAWGNILYDIAGTMFGKGGGASKVLPSRSNPLAYSIPAQSYLPASRNY